MSSVRCACTEQLQALGVEYYFIGLKGAKLTNQIELVRAKKIKYGSVKQLKSLVLARNF